MSKRCIMKLKLILIFLVVSILALSGCTKSLTEEELTAKILEANAKLDVYSSKSSLNMSMVSSEDFDMSTGSMMTTEGKINRKLKEGEATVSMNLLGMNINTKIYIKDDYVYTNVMNQWVKQKLDNNTWQEQDSAQVVLELMQYAQITPLKDDSFDGESYYVFEIRPDLNKLVELLLKGDTSGMLSEELNLKEVFTDYSTTIWVNKKSYIIEKSIVQATMNLSAVDLKDEQDSETNNDSLREDVLITMSMESTIKELKEPFEVILPSGAEKAQDISDLASLSDFEE
jgi:outer membrane lipoprotein-sorting protein